MKTLIKAVAFAAAVCGVPLAQAAEAGSIASKVEELGPMTYLRVSEMRAVKRDGLLRVQVTVSNITTSNQQLYYRFRWLDSDGFTVWEEEPWKPELVYGQQKKVIQAVSPSLKASDFRLEVQSPKNEGASPAN